MQGDNSDGPVAKARALLARWEQDREEQMQEGRFEACSPIELIKIAETGRDPDGVPLEGLDWAALDWAWQLKFGFPYLKGKSRRKDGTGAGAPKPNSRHPIFDVPDDAMLRMRDLIRLLGIPRTTLKNHIRAGKFPKPQPIIAGRRAVGWPARQIKAVVRGAD